MTKLRHIDFEVGDWGEFAGGPVFKRGYRSEVVAAGPMGYWRMGEAGGTVAVDEMGHYHGTFVGGVTRNEAGALEYDSNGAVRFDGSSGYINQGSTTMLNGASACTVVFWMKYGGAEVSGFGPIIGKTVGEGWMVTTNGVSYYDAGKPRTLAFYFNQSAGPTGVVYGPANLVRPMQWDFYACTFSGGAFARIYRNGELQAEQVGVASTMPTTSRNVWMGAVQQSLPGPLPHKLTGVLDELAVFDRALSGAELRAIYNAGAGR